MKKYSPVDMPTFDSDLRPTLRFDHPRYRSVAGLLTGAPREGLKPREIEEELLASLVIDMPYLVPGLGVYHVECPVTPTPERPRHAALRFVAQTQQSPSADAFACALTQTAQTLFAEEEV